MWAGPVGNWSPRARRSPSLGWTLVPGHGPVTDGDGVFELKRYLEYVRERAREMFDAGLGALEAADQIELGPFAAWKAPERIVQNVEELYNEFDPSRPAASTIEVFRGMARWAKRHSKSPGGPDPSGPPGSQGSGGAVP